MNQKIVIITFVLYYVYIPLADSFVPILFTSTYVCLMDVKYCFFCIFQGILTLVSISIET